jgi:hypothetical protein
MALELDLNMSSLAGSNQTPPPVPRAHIVSSTPGSPNYLTKVVAFSPKVSVNRYLAPPVWNEENGDPGLHPHVQDIPHQDTPPPPAPVQENHAVGGGLMGVGGPSVYFPIRRRVLKKASKWAREAVRLDSANDNPHGAVVAYSRSIGLLSEVLEQLGRTAELREQVETRKLQLIVSNDLFFTCSGNLNY